MAEHGRIECLRDGPLLARTRKARPDAPTPARRFVRKRRVASWTALLLTGLIGHASLASAQTYADSAGFYADIGLALGWNNMAGPFQPINNGTMVGFVFSGGYRFNGWFAAEAEFLWVGGGDILNAQDGLEYRASLTAFGIAGKIYPFAGAPDLMPQWIQPYFAFGIGTGLADRALVTVQFGSSTQSVLLTRVATGVDVMFTRHWGVTMDGSYYVTNNAALIGIGAWKLAVLCRF